MNTLNGLLYYKTTDGGNTGWKAFAQQNILSNGLDSIEVDGEDPAKRIIIRSNGILTTLNFGNSDPEGVVTSVVGGIYYNNTSATLWVKRTGGGTFGWVNISVTESLLSGSNSLTLVGTGVDRKMTLDSNGQSIDIRLGSAPPEDMVIGNVGDIFYDTVNANIWLKKTGDGNTGWVNVKDTDRILDGNDNIVINETENRTETTLDGITTFGTVRPRS